MGIYLFPCRISLDGVRKTVWPSRKIHRLSSLLNQPFCHSCYYHNGNGVERQKENFYGGQMNYKQGLISGIVLSVIIALLSPLTQWITTYVISPEYFPNVIKRSVELGYFKTTAEAEANFNYQNYAKQGALGALVMGIITTAIAMIFIRTKKAK